MKSVAINLENLNEPSRKEKGTKNYSGAGFIGDNALEFEAGYNAGWEDCFANFQKDQRRISEEAIAKIDDFSDSFEALKRCIVAGLSDTVASVFRKVIPGLNGPSISEIVLSSLKPLMESTENYMIYIFVSPEQRAEAEVAFSKRLSASVTIQEDSTLPYGEFFFKSGDFGIDFDQASAIEEILCAIDEFSVQDRREKRDV